MNPKAMILFSTGTNRDQDAAEALRLAGADTELVHITQLQKGERHWNAYQLLIIPGGFSYADALGAGKLLALDLEEYFAEEINIFVASGKPVIGICNGFQALVKAGILPTSRDNGPPPEATLTFNQSGSFECRWVTLQPVSAKCIWTGGLNSAIECPVAHGEGNFVINNRKALQGLYDNDQIAFLYSLPTGEAALGEYPYNPNGSTADIAGICNPAGNVLGMMPHPENHIYRYQHPLWTRNKERNLGLPLFINGVRFAAEL